MMEYPVPAPHLQAIGRIAVSFSGLEFQVAGLAIQLVSPSDQRLGIIITAELSFRNLLSLAASSCRHREPDEARQQLLDELLMRAGRLAEERNQIMHCIWAAGSKPDTICRVKYTAKQKRGYDAKFEEKSLADLNHLADELASLAGEILSWQLIHARQNGLVRTVAIQADGTVKLP